MFYEEQLVYHLVFLLCLETMAQKNFFLTENWVGSEAAGMKITVFVIFDPTWTHILAVKRSKYGILSTKF